MSTPDTIKIQPVVLTTTHRLLKIMAAHAETTIGAVIDGLVELAAKKSKLDGFNA